jgi:PEP-CTERM motif
MKTMIALTVSMLSFLPQWIMAQGNLVVNGGFDTDASGWTLTNVSSDGYQSSTGNPPGSVLLYNSSSLAASTASQEINSLILGDLYIISGDYELAGRKDVTDNSFGVQLNGLFLFETAAPADFNWHSFNFEYTATSTSALLSLSAELNGTGTSYIIDNISMEVIPEPNSLCLIGIGGIASAIFFKSRRKSLL